MSASLDSAVVTLAEAARHLGCHVETLRLRVRRGELDAHRGPHGRYLVSAGALAELRLRRRAAAAITDADFDRAWDVLQARLAARRATAGQLDMLAALRAAPSGRWRRLHRLAAVHALSGAGHSSGEIAARLGISARQVRRLRWLPIEIVLLRLDPWRPPSRREAERIVAGIRRSLAATGFRGHLRDPLGTRQPKRQISPAFRSQLSQSERRSLSHLGFTFSEIEAMNMVRLGADELNHLLLHGRPDTPAPA